MARRIVPRTDGALLAWSARLAECLSASPDTFGISAEIAQQYSDLQVVYATALQACAPASRSVTSTTIKSSAATALRLRSQQLVSIIHGQTDLGDDVKVSIGVNPRAQAAASLVPESSPTIHIVAVRNLTASLQLIGGYRGRPPRVSGALVYSFIGSEPPSNATEWTSGRVRPNEVRHPFPRRPRAGREGVVYRELVQRPQAERPGMRPDLLPAAGRGNHDEQQADEPGGVRCIAKASAFIFTCNWR